MLSNPTIDLLLSLSHTCAVQCLLALWAIGPLPVTQGAVAEAIGESDESAKRGLRRLKLRGLAICETKGGHETNWQLTPAAYQLPLPLDLLDLPHTPRPVQPDWPAPSPASLQARQPAVIFSVEQVAALGEDETDSAKSGIATPLKAESPADLLILLNKDSLSDSLKNKKNTEIATPLKTESPVAALARQELEKARARDRARNGEAIPSGRQPRWMSGIVRDLARKSQNLEPRPITDDPFPLAERVCVDKLISLGCSPKRAAEAVARTTWSADRIITEIAKWIAHKKSERGKTITDSGFPFLVASRIESQTACPEQQDWQTDDYFQAQRLVEQLTNPVAPEQSSNIPEEPPGLEANMPRPAVPSEQTEHWQATLEQIRLEMSKSTFETWVRDTTLIALEADDTYVIGVPNQHTKDWLENRLLSTMTRWLTRRVLRKVTVRFTVSTNP